MSKELTIISDGLSPEQINELLQNVTKKHDEVSRIETPKIFIKKKQNFDYVDVGYMKKLADKYFPGWSWKIISHNALGSEAYVVHGSLKFYDNGIMRTGDMIAAHTLQKLRGTQNFSNIGNDVKAANTDTMKKAFNMYMNIADDVYKKQIEDPELSDEQKKELLLLAKTLSDAKYTEILEKIEDTLINTMNFKGAKEKLQRLVSEYEHNLFKEGLEYTVGINDGHIFKEAVYIGKKMHGGKQMLVFSTHNKHEIIINPSYMSWALEDDTEIISEAVIINESNKGE